MPEVVTVEELKGKVGQDYGTSDWITVEQDQINAFAECTGDRQWIHVDIEAAKKGPFGGPIAHGFLTLSLLPRFGGKYFPEGAVMGVNYGLNKVRFLNPVAAGSKVRSNQVLTDVQEKPGNRVLTTVTHTIEIEGIEKPACVADALTMWFLQG